MKLATWVPGWLVRRKSLIEKFFSCLRKNEGHKQDEGGNMSFHHVSHIESLDSKTK